MSHQIPKKKTSQIYSPQLLNSKLIKILDFIERSVDHSKISENSSESILKIMKNSSNLSNSEIGKKILKALDPSQKCNCCSNGIAKIINSCSHKFCLNCSLHMVEKKGACLLCTEKISDDFRVSLLRSMPEANNLSVICKKCKYNSAYIDGEENCGHLCYPCIFSSLDLLDFSCWYCGNSFNHIKKLINYGIYCKGCGNPRFLYGDTLLHICCHNEPFCISCTESMVKSKHCVTCNSVLSLNDIMKILGKSFSRCSDCAEIFSKSNLTPCFACKNYLCTDCIENKGHHCLNRAS